MSSIRLRILQESDLDLLFAWSRISGIFDYLPSRPEHITWEEHFKWWSSRSENDYDYIVLYDDGKTIERAIGMCHLRKARDQESECGLYIADQDLWGKGLGVQVLEALIRRIRSVRVSLAANEKLICPSGNIIALIHPDNIRSKVAFDKAGFMPTDRMGRNEQQVWEYKL